MLKEALRPFCHAKAIIVGDSKTMIGVIFTASAADGRGAVGIRLVTGCRGGPGSTENTMGEANKVLARFLDGSVLMGTCEDILPNRPRFHLQPTGSAVTKEVHCEQLKAVYFVKDFDAFRHWRDVHGFPNVPPRFAQGKRVAVRFKAGELVCGYTLAYSPERSGFFMTPSDPASNNLRIYVLIHATQQVGVGPKADQLVQADAPPRAA